MEYALLVLFLEGLVLRLATLMALYCCPRGLTLEPLVVAIGTVFEKFKGLFGRNSKVKRRTTTVSGVSGAV